MNTEHFKKLLLEKERDLQSLIAELGGHGRASSEAEVRDYSDEATSEQGASDSFEQVSMLTDTLEQVQDALRRIEDGTYGKCILCGRTIEPARLEAVPWTPYCLEDQEKLDRPVPVATL